MDSDTRTAFDNGKIRLGGVDYQPAPLTAEHWQEALTRMKATRLSVFDVTRRGVEAFRDMPDQAQSLLEIAVRTARDGDNVSWPELTAWVASAENFWFRVWCQIRHNNREQLTEARVQQLVNEEFARLANQEGEIAALEWVTEMRYVLGMTTAEGFVKKEAAPAAA